MHKFGSPELTGHDGESIEVSVGLAGKLRKHATDEAQIGCDYFLELGTSLAAAIQKAGAQIAREPIEWAIILSASGEVLKKKRGKRGHVRVESEWLAGTILVHNHPDETPLSIDDVEALFSTDLVSVWAIGGKWLYGAEIGAKGRSPSALSNFRMACGHLSEAAFAVISDLFRHEGAIGEEFLEIAHQHAVLSELAADGFIRYCRVRYAT